MGKDFDEFESVMKKELELAVPSYFNLYAIENGFKSAEDGSYQMAVEDIPTMTSKVVLDAVFLMLRRYQEWMAE